MFLVIFVIKIPNNRMFLVIFVIIIIKITIITIIIIIATIIIIIGICPLIRAKRCFLCPKKENQVAQMGGEGVR